MQWDILTSADPTIMIANMGRTKDNKAFVGFYMEDHTLMKTLKHAAVEEERSVSSIIEDAIKEYIKKHHQNQPRSA